MIKEIQMLIDFEGLDGSGKFTQANMLKKRLQLFDKKVEIFSYPKYDSKYGEILKKFLFDKINLTVEEQVLLHLLDMLEDRDKINELINNGYFIILDRYYPSTIAYQCSNGFDYKSVISIIKELRLPIPTIVFNLDITPCESINRKIQQDVTLDKYENNSKLLNNVALLYNRMMNDKVITSDWLKIDALQSREDIHEQIMSVICSKCDLD